MTILFAASEVAPMASTGGLGEVVSALPEYLSQRGYDVAVALPAYPSLMEGSQPVGVEFHVPMGDGHQPCSLHERIGPGGVQWLLIHNETFFSREGIYGDSEGPYPDNASRFIFFSKAVVELAKRLQPSPQILHANDWHTALIPMLVRDQYLPIKTVLTLQNVQHQGAFWGLDFPLTNLAPGWFNPGGIEFHGGINLLKGGILASDFLTTVSANYRQSILYSEQGCGLQEVLQSRQSEFFVVPNGVCPKTWDPASKKLAAPFSPKNLKGKQACREALLKELDLEPGATDPIYAMVGRLSDQKGFDLLLPILPKLFSANSRLIIMGDGDPTIRRDLLMATRQHAGRLAYLQNWDPELSTRILAGTDVLLTPSHFEPFGLTSLHGLRFGAIPLAHATGGLLENLENFEISTGKGNALLYFRDSCAALWDTVQRAKMLFMDKTQWHKLVANAMHSTFRWEDSAAAYDRIYRTLAPGH